MGLMEQAKLDILQITTNTDEFATPIVFTPPAGSPKTVNGIGVKHNLSYDTYGNAISSKTSRITVSEQALVNAGYVVRNSSKEVDLINHLVQWTDVMGNSWTYQVIKNMAGETNAIIVLILADYKA